MEPITASINSSTFYFYWQVFFDAFKAGKLCVESFPLGIIDDCDQLTSFEQITRKLMTDFRTNAVRQEAQYSATGRVCYDQFYPRKSKHIMDEIDILLARHYGFTEDETYYIVNYDIKFRASEDGPGEGSS